MAKTEKKQPFHPPTEDEMRTALHRLDSVKLHLTMLPDDDDPTAVLLAVIEELLASRQALEDVRGFMTLWTAKMARR